MAPPGLGASSRFQEPQTAQHVREHQVYPCTYVTRAVPAWELGLLHWRATGWLGRVLQAPPRPFLSSFCQLLAPFQILLLPRGASAWSCQAWSTAQETLESLARELRALCVLHNLALNLQGESLKMLNISKMCPPLSSYVTLSRKTLPLAAPSRGVCARDSPSSVLETPMCHCHLLQGNV